MTEMDPAERLAAAARRAEQEMEELAKAGPRRVPPTGPSAVYSIRLPVGRVEELRELAAERGMAPTGLMRNWVLAQLDAASGNRRSQQEWEDEFRATAERLRELLDERP